MYIFAVSNTIKASVYPLGNTVYIVNFIFRSPPKG